jgi:hypothetical protein
MAECDERRWLAALSLMNSGMEADDASNKTFVAVMCPINRQSGNYPSYSKSRIQSNHGCYLARIVPRRAVILLQIFAIETFVLL